MTEVKAIMDELHSLRDINVSDLDELGKEQKMKFFCHQYRSLNKAFSFF